MELTPNNSKIVMSAYRNGVICMSNQLTISIDETLHLKMLMLFHFCKLMQIDFFLKHSCCCSALAPHVALSHSLNLSSFFCRSKDNTIRSVGRTVT